MFLNSLKKSSEWPTFRIIILAALVVRLIAAFFSPGYGMFDDHFLVIEPAASWADGFDFDYWLPWTAENGGTPKGHSFSYIGLNFFYFSAMKAIGINDPKTLMLFNRIIHALFSMLVVIYGIKITRKLAGDQLAKTLGWFLAVLWIMPFVSVRNLVEFSAVPFLIMGVWYLIRDRNKYDLLVAGLLVGMSVSFRYQVGVFAVGIAAVYFFRFQWKPFLLYCLGVLITFTITQGLVDFLIWGYPFAEFLAYSIYNANQGTQYMPNQNYGMYFFVLMGSFLVPLGIAMMAGFFKSWKKYTLLFVPTMLFILFHTIYPNRQERFILTVLPIFAILGVIGYDLFKNTNFKQRAWRISIIAFWVLNIPLLIMASTMYSKKSRIESAYSLLPYKNETKLVLLEGTASGKVNAIAKFYTGDWKLQSMERKDTIQPMNEYELKQLDFIFFHDDKNLDKRIAKYKKLYPKMELIKQCDPSFLDHAIYTINPLNVNEYIEVWKTNSEF